MTRKQFQEPAEVYPVPPLARKNDPRRTLDFVQNEKLLRFLEEGGIRRVVYGGNAFLYHITLSEYRELIDWLGGLTGETALIPAIGPSYGRAMDQAPLLRRYRFPTVLVLPCADPRDAAGLETGLREIADACGMPLMLYMKDETNFGADKDAGLDVVARLVADGVCGSVKYAVVRKDPLEDAYLESLLKRVDPGFIISGIGERPAVAHLRNFKLNGFTTGSGCLAPRLTRLLLTACVNGNFEEAELIRSAFIPLEDLRDAWGPSRVLHAAAALAGVVETGPIPPFVSALSVEQLTKLEPVAQALLEKNGAFTAALAS